MPSRDCLPVYPCDSPTIRGVWCALALLASLATSPTAPAQDALANSAQQRAQSYSTNSPAATPRGPGTGTALLQDATESEKETDSDLGEQWVLHRSERLQRWNVYTDVFVFGTSNVALASRHEASDAF